ncbi:MAG: TetR/AcrR family transcriptional regulator [Aquisalinus sp.]|nr:TetR/AcrR family transcriptional regulator [Aquisalinus sp.]
MPRPSLKAERREVILDAYEACVARYGVEGASLEKIATEADLARPLIRHNVGNREDLLQALIERYMERSRSIMQSLIVALPENNKAETLVEWLFDPQHSDAQSVLVAEALIAAGQDDKLIARQMRNWTKAFIKSISDVLQSVHPHTDPQKINAIATGITGIYFNAESLMPLGKTRDIRAASREAALLLISTLIDKSDRK